MPSSKYLSWDKDDFIKNSSDHTGKICEYGMNYDSQANKQLSVEELTQLIKKLYRMFL